MAIKLHRGFRPDQIKPVSPSQLEKAVGPECLQWLLTQTGMSKDELLAGLSKELPNVVDKLTPEGRRPTEQEASRMAAPK
jgi:uncharacterized protein YidB (DUF937 family)